jgi:hypothetical protein
MKLLQRRLQYASQIFRLQIAGLLENLSMPGIHTEEQKNRDLSESREMLDDFDVQLLELKRDARA